MKAIFFILIGFVAAIALIYCVATRAPRFNDPSAPAHPNNPNFGTPVSSHS